MSVYPPENSFNILLATDIHLGYAEKDQIRGQDSFNTFEEILQIAVENEVDFILLGGDLFHDAKPSTYCIFKCMELLRKYCLGDKPIGIEYLSDQSYDFKHLPNPTVNYEDPNLNVAIPVFSIHGNHDDPSGQKSVSALDILASSGLVNYFGRYENYQEIEISPILLSKGESQIALYGLSHIRDERLGRMFRDKKVFFNKMPEDESWFNIFVLHQNRVTGRGTKNFIPESCLPDFLHLVMWGHEHDCRIDEEEIREGVYITQPGSSVATSLSEGEAIEKKVGLLKIHKKTFRIEPIVLKTVRPFFFEQLLLKSPEDDDYSNKDPKKQTEEFLIEKIEGLLKEIKQTRKSEGLPEMLPLVRLIVFYYTERQIVNQIAFGQKFIGKVANPEDMISVKPNRNKERCKRRGEFDDDAFENVEQWSTRVEDVVQQQFRENKVDALKVLSVKGVTEAVKRYIDIKDSEALPQLFENQINEACKMLEEKDVEPAKLKDYFKDIYIDETADDERDFSHIFKTKLPPPKEEDDSNNEEEDEEMDSDEAPVKPTRGRGSRGGGKGARGRGKKGDEVVLVDDDGAEVIIASTSKSARGRGRGSRGGRAPKGTSTTKRKSSIFD